MDVSAYRCFADSLVPYGYILLLPRTEGGISPSHQQFGLDLRFLNEQMKTEGRTPTSFFYQRVAPTSAIMGHSMGGGASFLAAAAYTGVTTVVNFAAAETNPSSIQAAKQVTVPVLMFIGENDGVTPPAQHQLPMFDSCASTCKIRNYPGWGALLFCRPQYDLQLRRGYYQPPAHYHASRAAAARLRDSQAILRLSAQRKPRR
jgi:dienelactone hydrolase